MPIFRILTETTGYFFGSFKKECPEQFSTKRKNNVIYCFTVVGVDENGVTIKSLVDKHTDTIAFDDVQKVKTATGEVLKVEKYDIVAKQYVMKHFMESEEPLVVYDADFNQVSIDSIKAGKGTATLLSGETEYALESVFVKETEITFG